MKNLQHRVSMGSIQRRQTVAKSTEELQSGQKEILALDKVLARLIKGLEKGLARWEDKTEMVECATAAASDAHEAPDLAKLLSQLAQCQLQLRRDTDATRQRLDTGVLGALRALRAGPLKDVVATQQQFAKASDTYARDEKSNTTKPTPESKARLQASHEALTQAQASLSDALQTVVPECRQQLRAALALYAADMASFHESAQRNCVALKDQSGGSGGASGSNSSSSSSSSGYFGVAVAAICEREGSAVPKFVAAALQSLATVKDQPLLYRASDAPEQACAALRAQVEAHGGNVDLGRVNVLAVAAIARAWFAELPQPLLGAPDAWFSAVASQDATQRSARLARQVAALNARSAALLQRLVATLDAQLHNGAHAARVASLWGTALLRPANADDAGMAALVVQALVQHKAQVFAGMAAEPAAPVAVAVEPVKVVAKEPVRSAVASLPVKEATVSAVKKPVSPRALPTGPAATTTAPGPAKASSAKVAPSLPVKPVAAKAALTKTAPAAKSAAAPGGTSAAKAPPAKAAPVKAAPPAKSPPATRKPPAGSKSPAAGHKPVLKRSSYDDLDSDDSKDGSDVDDDGGDAIVEDPDGMVIMGNASAADVEDVQALGVLGMFLSAEKKASFSPVVQRQSTGW